MIQAVLLNFIEWVASKGAALVWKEISDAIAKHKEQQALAKNQDALQKAIQSGDKNAVEKAGENSLNNSSN